MFDKLIVSDALSADVNSRRNYFMVSSLVVGVLFLAAVVFSIFASDYGLGNHEFELVEMLPPMTWPAEPEPPNLQLRRVRQVSCDTAGSFAGRVNRADHDLSVKNTQGHDHGLFDPRPTRHQQ